MKGSQFAKPLFEFSGACAGCGETPYIKFNHAIIRDENDDSKRDGMFYDIWWDCAVIALYCR